MVSRVAFISTVWVTKFLTVAFNDLLVDLTAFNAAVFFLCSARNCWNIVTIIALCCWALAWFWSRASVILSDTMMMRV